MMIGSFSGGLVDLPKAILLWKEKENEKENKI
jgi:hypothetical protein